MRNKLFGAMTLLGLLALLVGAPASAQSFAPITYPSGCWSRCNGSPNTWVRTNNGYGFVDGGNTATVTQGEAIWFSGTVPKRTRASFALINEATGQVAYTHTTNPSRDNCVIHHEPEYFNTGWLAPGRYRVVSTYWSYCYPVVDEFLGTLVVQAYVPPVCDPPQWELDNCSWPGGFWNWSSCQCEYVYDPCGGGFCW